MLHGLARFVGTVWDSHVMVEVHRLLECIRKRGHVYVSLKDGESLVLLANKWFQARRSETVDHGLDPPPRRGPPSNRLQTYMTTMP